MSAKLVWGSFEEVSLGTSRSYLGKLFDEAWEILGKNLLRCASLGLQQVEFMLRLSRVLTGDQTQLFRNAYSGKIKFK